MHINQCIKGSGLHALKMAGRCLVETHQVAYCPSSSILRHCQGKRRTKRECVLSLGIEFEKEAREIGMIFGCDARVYTGPRVTKVRVLSECKGKDIIHFSCRGNCAAESVAQWGLQLYGEEVLTISDVLQMKLNANLVTLSACQTALNLRTPGNELHGLTRSFIYAGAVCARQPMAGARRTNN